jgi:hypothetical protein
MAGGGGVIQTGGLTGGRSTHTGCLTGGIGVTHIVSEKRDFGGVGGGHTGIGFITGGGTTTTVQSDY